MGLRAHAFIDGFNLYHAVANSGRSSLKWLDLWALCEVFAPGPHCNLEKVIYFSAFATWRPGSYRRHQEYVSALRCVGVTTFISRFKLKDRSCHHCGHRWMGHEEKESDVALGVNLVAGALRDEYDRALLISNDSDPVPARL